MRRWTVPRVGFGLLVLAAIGWQLTIQARMGASLVNFFSFFTNLSNLLAGAMLLLCGLRIYTGDALRLASAVNMVVVGIVFAALLRDVDLGSLRPWINFVLHYVMPVVVVADWLLHPPARKLAMKQLLWVLVFPALYLVYTVARGAAVGWYPYPFLDPASVGGFGGVALHAAGVALTFGVAAWVLLTLGHARATSTGK